MDFLVVIVYPESDEWSIVEYVIDIYLYFV